MTIDPEKLNMVDISSINQNIILDIRYASTNNFTGKVLYPVEYKCMLRKGTAIKLNNAQKDFESLGYGIKIFDAYRPYSIQKLLWELIKDERYVMKWPHPSVHNRGASVDLSLITQKGEDIDMGTDFDEFSERACINYKDLPERVLFHRNLLREIMIKNGFLAISTEWWHFNDSEYQNYDVLD